MQTIRAVLFDLGGVILTSPLEAFEAFEREAQLPTGLVARINTVNPDTNAWACMERGELEEDEFYRRFEGEACALGVELDARALLRRLSGRVRPEMADLVRFLRSRYRVACLTNNMHLGHGVSMASGADRAREVGDVLALFPHVLESRELRMRKPERRFYEHACAVIGVLPAECVFLDDLGTNLKPARALGMRTIKVVTSNQAIADLEAILGHAVCSSEEGGEKDFEP